MARLASIQVGGYFPTPIDVMENITSMITKSDPNHVPVIVDPCAGEGEAASVLSHHLKGQVYAVEMEKHRANATTTRLGYSASVAEGDFFQLHAVKASLGNSGADVMYLNPPYDTDKEMGRLEERFLRRALTLMKFGGTLVFVVPHASLKASAKTLASNFTNLSCYRFPDHEWGFKQVALFGNRIPCMEDDLIDESKIASIEGWAQDPSSLKVIGQDRNVYTVSGHGRVDGFNRWEILSLDIVALAEEYSPWESTGGPIHGIAPPLNAYEMMGKKYPLASKPRAVHLSAALSAGVFNGVKVVPDDPESTLPPILIKGVFDKEYRKIEEKQNKEGIVIAEVQVQQPKLVVSILDLSKGTFHEVAPSSIPSEELDVAKMSMKDLLDHYGKDLMRGMLEACPVLHDPANDPDPLPLSEDIKRPLFPAQAEAVRTIVKLKQTYPDRGSIILGELGSGKTSCALASIATLNKQRALVVCPPHLLDSWKNEINAVVPSYRSFVLESISDVEEFAKYEGKCIAILSREKAKLSHGWEGIKAERCPQCFGKIPKDVDHGKKRSRCFHTVGKREPANKGAEWLMKALPELLPYFPSHTISKLVDGRIHKKLIEKWKKDPKEYRGPTQEMVNLFRELIPLMKEGTSSTLKIWLAWAIPELTLDVAFTIPVTSSWDSKHITRTHLDVLLATTKDEVETYFNRTLPALDTPAPAWYYSHQKAREEYVTVTEHGIPMYGVSLNDGVRFRKNDANTPLRLGSKEALAHLLDLIIPECSFRKRPTCNEPWFQGVGPNRYALASWIQKRLPSCYDILILDEAHEFSGRDSAQTSAAQKLMSSDVPTILLTGSLLNGYAESVYMNMYGISPEFKQKFGRDNVSAFIDRYGYWKQIVQDKDTDGQIIEFGSNSDRVIRSVRKAGVAPGILPLFQLEYILPCAVTLQKEDLGLGIPPCKEHVIGLHAEGDLLSNYEMLLSALKDEIKRTRFEPGMAGKLWGAFAHMPSYLDLACVGNTEDGQMFELKWPESVPDLGGTVIASVPTLDPDILLPKEKYLLDTIQREVAEGRNVMVMAWHLRLIPRLEKIISHAGYKTIVLDAAKVSTSKRQEWIEKKVVKPKVQVMICNPMVIQTGLNNLVHFGTEIWVENPSCNAIIYRQACGRIDRIGQTVPSTIVFPIYENTAQSHQHRLLMHKVGVSKSVDGLDPEEALKAAGVVDSDFMGFSVGKQLYNMMMES